LVDAPRVTYPIRFLLHNEAEDAKRNNFMSIQQEMLDHLVN
jgi:hypothetical protein